MIFPFYNPYILSTFPILLLGYPHDFGNLHIDPDSIWQYKNNIIYIYIYDTHIYIHTYIYIWYICIYIYTSHIYISYIYISYIYISYIYMIWYDMTWYDMIWYTYVWYVYVYMYIYIYVPFLLVLRSHFSSKPGLAPPAQRPAAAMGSTLAGRPGCGQGGWRFRHGESRSPPWKRRDSLQNMVINH
jgi:hypothetical protein